MDQRATRRGQDDAGSSYLAERGIRHLWSQLDAGDGDPGTFFHYLGLGVRNAALRDGNPLPHLTAEYLSGLPVFAWRYFEALSSELEPPCMLVFDNYQDVPGDAALHRVMRDGIAALSQGFIAVVLSRAQPPAELARSTVGLISRLPSTRLSHPFAGSSVADQPAAVPCTGRAGRRQVTVVVSCP